MSGSPPPASRLRYHIPVDQAREEQPHIFDLFFSRGSNGGDSSSGIGLAIVKKTIEAYKGRVWVESDPGHGARFYVYLPETKA